MPSFEWMTFSCTYIIYHVYLTHVCFWFPVLYTLSSSSWSWSSSCRPVTDYSLLVQSTWEILFWQFQDLKTTPLCAISFTLSSVPKNISQAKRQQVICACCMSVCVGVSKPSMLTLYSFSCRKRSSCSRTHIIMDKLFKRVLCQKSSRGKRLHFFCVITTYIILLLLNTDIWLHVHYLLCFLFLQIFSTLAQYIYIFYDMFFL